MDQRMGIMEKKLDDLIASVHTMQSDMTAMKAEVSETKEIVQAWRSMKLWAQFVKWFAGIITAMGVIFAAWTGLGK